MKPNEIREKYKKLFHTDNKHVLDNLSSEDLHDFLQYAKSEFKLVETSKNDSNTNRNETEKNELDKLYKKSKEVLNFANWKYENSLPQMELNIEKWVKEQDLNNTIAEKIAERTVSMRIEQPETTTPESIDNFEISAKQRFYLLEKTGLLQTEMFKSNGITQNAKHSLLAKILSCDVRTAKGMFNKEPTYEMSIDNYNVIEKLYNKITKNKDL